MKWFYEYLKLIRNGKPVSEEVKLALDRIPEYLNRFDYRPEYPNKLIDFIQHFIYLQKGSRSKKPMKLTVEQKFWIELFGFCYPGTTHQVITDIALVIGAGSGKSTFVAALSLAVMMVGSHKGNDVLVMANSIRQAQETFRTASEMVSDERSPLYQLDKKKLLYPVINKINYKVTNSNVQIKAMDPRTADGVNVRLAVYDEIHAYHVNVIENVRKSAAPKRIETGFTSIFITTNGQVRGEVFDTYYNQWEDILHGRTEDWSVFPMIYKLDDIKEVSDESKYEKAMPFINQISSPDVIKGLLLKAKGNPVAQSEILAKSFNIPQTEFNSLFTNSELQQAQQLPFNISQNKKTVYVGFDLSSVNDLSSLVISWEKDGQWESLSHSFVPRETFDHRCSVEQRERYHIFADADTLTIMPGSMISEKGVFAWLRDYLSDHHLSPLGFAGDAYYSADFKKYLSDYYGESMVYTVRQNVANLSDPLKKVSGLIHGHDLKLDDQLLPWSLSNLRVKVDANGNVYPNKARAVDKIDPVLALIQSYWLYNKINSDNVWLGL